MVCVKICGITNIEDAVCAAEAGADFLGFIFYSKSPRYIIPEQAGEIVQGVRAQVGEVAPRFVGVFVDESVDAVRAIIETTGLDLVQLHGNETPSEVTALAPYSFKAIRPQNLAEAKGAFTDYVRHSCVVHPLSTVYADANTRLPSVRMLVSDFPALLVDAYHPSQKGGTGQVADLEIAQWLAQRCQLLLAGGLTPNNVADAIARVHPWGVDVSSGVEVTKGKKDHNKIKRFIQQVKAQ